MAFLRNPVVYVPDLNNGRPIVDGKVYALVSGTVPPMHDSAIDPLDLLTVTYENEAGNIVEATQPLYTSKGGCLYGNYPDSARQYMVTPQEYVYAVYNRIGQLEYSGETTASDYVETNALAATDSTVLIASVQAGQVGSNLIYQKTLFDFGADETADATAALISAVTYIQSNPNYSLNITGNHLIDTFAQTLADGVNAAVKITGDVRIFGNGSLRSTTSSVSNCIFGADSTSGQRDISIKGLLFKGDNRYRAFYAAVSTLNSLEIEGVKTERQSIVSIADYVDFVKVENNKVGLTVDSGTAKSPQIFITRPSGVIDRKLPFSVSNNILTTGTEVLSSGAYVIHQIPIGGTVDRNTHINAGLAANEGFDIDNVGKFARIINNTSWGAGFEYKTGTGGFTDSRDIIFSNNISYASVLSAAFSIRSSCNGTDNIAYNPASYGVYMSVNTDSDGMLVNAFTKLSGFKIVWAGASWVSAVKIDNGVGGIDLDRVCVEIDPVYLAANPSAKLPLTQFNIDGNVTNLAIRNSFIDKSVGDQINFRPSTTATKVLLENIRFGDTDDSCIDLANCTNVVISNPVFPATIVDRPVRLSTCSAVRIVCDYHASITLAATSGSNTGVLINNLGYEAAGAATAPSADGKWPIGATVQNTSDNSVWLRVSGSTTPATAWKQIA